MPQPRFSAEHRLATYGTLAPGRVNHAQLAGLSGTWRTGTVRGTLFAQGWGADHGCPGIVLGTDGSFVDVHLFESPDLPQHWSRLDAFEGLEYRRTATRVETDEGEVEAFIYQLRQAP